MSATVVDLRDRSWNLRMLEVRGRYVPDPSPNFLIALPHASLRCWPERAEFIVLYRRDALDRERFDAPAMEPAFADAVERALRRAFGELEVDVVERVQRPALISVTVTREVIRSDSVFEDLPRW